jgi:hypothetical protein
MSKRMLLLVGFVLLVSGTLAIRAQENATPAGASASGEAAKRLKVAQAGLDFASRLEVEGKAEFETVKTWSLRVMDAERGAGGDAAEPIRNHLDRMVREVKIAEARKQAARATSLDILDAQYAVLEAEEMLAKAKAGHHE